MTEVGRHLWAQFAPITIGALIVLELVQIPLAWSMARRLQASQRERERLLRHALDASDAERRRIASDLHDGVVQELTGVSLSLAAQGRSDSIGRQQVLDASSAIRTSIKSLRSLLVEIYPPNLQEEGLQSAIGDLLSGLTARGFETRLEADLGEAVVDPEAAGLIYRAAQESLRNVVSHSGATHVRVELQVVADSNQRELGPAARRRRRPWFLYRDARRTGRRRARRSPRPRRSGRRSGWRPHGAIRARRRHPGRGFHPDRRQASAMTTDPGEARTIRVLVVDDHVVVRSGLEQLLATTDDIELVGTASNGNEAIAAVASLHPDVVLMDLSMPELDGVEATRRISADAPVEPGCSC